MYEKNKNVNGGGQAKISSQQKLIENASQANSLFQKKHSSSGMSSLVLESEIVGNNAGVNGKKKQSEMEIIHSEQNYQQILERKSKKINKQEEKLAKKSYQTKNDEQIQNQIFTSGFDDNFFQDPMPDEEGFLGSFMNQNQNKYQQNVIFEGDEDNNQLFFQQRKNSNFNNNNIDFFGHEDETENEIDGMNLSDHFGSQLMIVGGDDLNKIHQNFAGDTFSQISSTYEQIQNQNTNSQKAILSVKHSSLTTNQGVNSGNGLLQNNHQQSQLNEGGRSEGIIQSKLHFYQEKNRPNTKVKMHHDTNQHHNNDELLDSMILNNLNDDLNTQRDNNQNNNNNNYHNNANNNQISSNNGVNYLNHLQSKGNQILDFKSQKQSNGNNNHNHKQVLGYHPSSNSNLNNIMMMNSEQLQQSDIQSTMTIYNSGIFDDASIMRILDKSITDDSLFVLQQQQLIDDLNSNYIQSQQQHMTKNQSEIVEQSLGFECKDVKQILTNISAKYKEKLQKQRQSGVQPGSGQIVGLTFEELKSYEIQATSAIEKIRQIQMIGKVIVDSQRVKSLTFKNHKQNLKIQLHNQIKKFKDVCKRQFRQTENWKFKYQINEFETNEKIQQLEERLDRQSDEINKLANRCEQLKFEKDCLAKKNEQKLKDMDKIVKVVIRNLAAQDQERLNKINNSFCVGASDHSMLLQPRSKRKFQNHLTKLQSNNDAQQSVDEKENESILSNHAIKFDNREMKNYLERIQKIIRDNRKYNQLYLKKGAGGQQYQNQQQQSQQEQEGGSCYQSSQHQQQMLMMQGFNDHENQQSQFIPDEEDCGELDMNKAFIENQNDSKSSDSKSLSYKPGDRMIDITEESIDYEFDQNQVLVVMDGKQPNLQGDKSMEESKKSLENLLDIQDKISTKDLKGQNIKHFDQSPSDRHLIQFERERMLKVSGLQRFEEHKNIKNQSNQQHHQFNNINNLLNFNHDNSIDADLEILGNLQKLNDNNNHLNLKNQMNLSNEFSGFMMSDEQFKKSQIMVEEEGLGLNDGAGKNIMVFDDFNGEVMGSQGFSRNQVVGNLYSGGSSQLSMIQAFPNSNRIGKSKDMIIVRVLDRKIPIPKLNIQAIHRREKLELFDKNIPDLENSESSSITQSEIQQSSISQSKMTLTNNNYLKQSNNYYNNNVATTDPQNITSFQNESISKQGQSQIDHTQNSSSVKGGGAFGEGGNLLDQAIYHDSQQSKSNISHSSSHKHSKSGGVAGYLTGYQAAAGRQSNQGLNGNMQNMFDSFKQELGMLDSIKKISGAGERGTFENNQSSNKQVDQTLDLFNDDSIDKDKNQDIFSQEFKNEQLFFKNQEQLQYQNKGEYPKNLKNVLELNFNDTSQDKSKFFGKNYPHIQSIDLSVNISKFKKSLSDPNLMFNDVDSDNEAHQQTIQDKSKNTKLVTQNDQASSSQVAQPSQLIIKNTKLVQNMTTKIKTPQGPQVKGKFKFTTSNNNNNSIQHVKVEQINLQEKAGHEEEVKDSAVQKVNVRKSLGLFQVNLRKSIGQSRQSQDEQPSSSLLQKSSYELSQNQNIQQQVQPLSPGLQSIANNIKLKSIQHQNTTSNQSQSPKSQQNNKGARKQQANLNILRALSSNSNKNSEGGDSQGVTSELNSQTNSISKKSQLIQNYMQGAASMNGSNSSQLSKQTISKIMNPQRTSFQRNQVTYSHHSQQEELKPPSTKNGINSELQERNLLNNSKQGQYEKSIIQEMKDHLESQELDDENKNFLRKRPDKNQDSLNDDSKYQLSPNAKRQSQSHTPKKRDMIIVNTQQIKNGQKIKLVKAHPNSVISNIQKNNNNDSQINISEIGASESSNQILSQSVVRQSQPLKKITLQRKMLIKKVQNGSVIENSIDQSQIMVQPRQTQPNQSFLNGNNDDDASIMINDISVIQPALTTAITNANSTVIQNSANIIKNLRKKSQIAKINPANVSNLLNMSAVNQTVIGGANQSVMLSQNNNSQLNLSSIHNSSISKIGGSIHNPLNNNSMIQVKNIVAGLPNQNFISQQIIEKIKRQKIDSQQSSNITQNNANITVIQSHASVNLSNYHSNPNQVNEQNTGDGNSKTLNKESHTQSNEKLIKIPQRVVLNTALLQQQKLLTQQKNFHQKQKQNVMTLFNSNTNNPNPMGNAANGVQVLTTTTINIENSTSSATNTVQVENYKYDHNLSNISPVKNNVERNYHSVQNPQIGGVKTILNHHQMQANELNRKSEIFATEAGKLLQQNRRRADIQEKQLQQSNALNYRQ